MNKQEAILKIKETLKSLMKFESDVVENTFAEVMTKDGVKIVFDGDTLTTDTLVYKLDEAGNRIPCEDMEYILEDGRTIVVTGGKVSEIKEETVVADGGETPVEDANVEAKKSEDKMEVVEGEGMEPVVETEVEVEKPEEENTVEMRIAKLEANVMKCMEMLSSLTDVSQEMTEKFEEFSKLPAESAIGSERKFERQLTQEEIRVERLKQLKNSL
jgi:hypothetical protein